MHPKPKPTTFIQTPLLDKRLGRPVLLAVETFQPTGSFKFRAAHYLASHIPHDTVLTASSGNFGQAIAYACSLFNKKCIVVMPSTSARVKQEAVKGYGGIVEIAEVGKETRLERVQKLAQKYPEAYIASPYDDTLVIQGNSSLGRELSEVAWPIENVIVPVGGGGLASGIISGLRSSGKESIRVFGAEPLLANDGARSLREGKIVSNDGEPQTLADGARTPSLGKHNWEILREYLAEMIEVPEEAIREAVHLLFHTANLKVEPTGALSVAAALSLPNTKQLPGLCCVVSGGNVDTDLYCGLLQRP